MENRGKTPRICIIGAGFSGLCMAIQLKEKLNLKTFTIYETCGEVGGTWYVNTYPGCACDVPSHLYSFSFAPKYDWSQMYSPQKEILEYMKDVTNKFGIYPYIRFHSRIECLRWNDQTHKWHATILNVRNNRTKQEEFDIIINGTGKIRIPHYPAEYLNFQGELVHTAKWHSVSLSGKRVGVIGTGASAIQIITAIATEVEHLTVFQRKAPLILPRAQFNFSNVAKWALANIPGLAKLNRYALFLSQELLYGGTRYESLANKALGTFSRWYRNAAIKDPGLREKATPKYTPGCKRVLISENYYSTLTQSNVDLVTDTIEKVEGHHLVTSDGRQHKFDVLILATGYQSQDFFAPMSVFGRNGVDVLEEWRKDRPSGYLGILYREMPNFFSLLGPYTSIGHNSILFNLECQVDWTIKAIKMMMDKKATSITITRETENEFMEAIDKQMEGSVWIKGNCNPWYLDGRGQNTLLWPYNQFVYWKMCRRLEESMFEFTF